MARGESIVNRDFEHAFLGDPASKTGPTALPA
jgi:hypothetical protein